MAYTMYQLISMTNAINDNAHQHKYYSNVSSRYLLTTLLEQTHTQMRKSPRGEKEVEKEKMGKRGRRKKKVTTTATKITKTATTMTTTFTATPTASTIGTE